MDQQRRLPRRRVAGAAHVAGQRAAAHIRVTAARRTVSAVLLLLLISCSSPPATPSADRTAEPASSPTPAVVSTPAPAEGALPAPADAVPVTAPTAAEPVELATAEPAPTAPETVEHVVQPGETLLSLALEYQVPMAAIQLQNELGAETGLQAGQVLEVPPSAGWEGASSFWVVHLVPEGATLSGIAATYSLDLAALRLANDVAAGDLLRVGQPLILPLEMPAEVARVPDPTPVPPPPTVTPVPTLEPRESPRPTAQPLALPPPAPLPAEVAAWPAEVFRLINAVRAQHGLPPYVYDETLAQAAQLHGQDCQQRGWCGHTGSDGSNVKARILRAGYDAAGWAECIVYSSSPQAAVEWWMDEVPPNDAHRRTLLSTWVTEIGIAVVPTDSDTYYFIADFGRPRTS